MDTELMKSFQSSNMHSFGTNYNLSMVGWEGLTRDEVDSKFRKVAKFLSRWLR